MPDIICIGECMVELRQVDDAHFRYSFAGDAYNTAVYLKRSAPEFDIAFLTAIGDEALSLMMANAWRGEGINDDLAFRVPHKLPALYMIENDDRGERTFRYWRTDSSAKQWLQQLLQHGGSVLLNRSDLIYISGISLAILSDIDRQEAIKLFRAVKAPIAFDPNVRPNLWLSVDEAKATFEALASIASVLLPSKQDLEFLYGPEDLDIRARQIMSRAQPSAELAITADEAGCLVYYSGAVRKLPANRVEEVVDTSGAGDAFNGAYLAARLRGQSPFEGAQAGLELAAKVVGKFGAIVPA